MFEVPVSELKRSIGKKVELENVIELPTGEVIVTLVIEGISERYGVIGIRTRDILAYMYAE